MSIYNWHFGYIPSWVIKHIDPHHQYYDSHIYEHGFTEKPHGKCSIESFIQILKGKHYEYAWVVMLYDHTHDNAILKRKLRRK